MSDFKPTDIRSETKHVDRERKHLEGLLKDRINFYLVFASVFMLGLSRIEDVRIKAWALLTISVVSLLIALAVLRTHCLVQLALADIRKDENHPYTRYWQASSDRSSGQGPTILPPDRQLPASITFWSLEACSCAQTGARRKVAPATAGPTGADLNHDTRGLLLGLRQLSRDSFSKLSTSAKRSHQNRCCSAKAPRCFRYC